MKTFLVLLSLVVAGCASTPAMDTNEKRLAAAEITYNNTLKTVNKNINRMSDSQRRNIKDSILDINKALKAARLALSIRNDVLFNDNISTVNTSIDVLRAILETMEEDTSYELNSLKRDYFA